MAKLSSINKNNRRIKLSNKYYKKRISLKKIIMDKKLPLEERFKAQQKLSQLPRNSAKNRMYEFIDRLVNIALPRIKDFRGFSTQSFDKFGNYTFGIKEHIIFPEVNFDKVEKIRGLDITIVISSLNKEHSYELLKKLNFPFKIKGAN